MALGGRGERRMFKISKRWNPVESSDTAIISCTTGYIGTTGLLLLPERAVKYAPILAKRVIYEIELLTLFHL